MIDQPNNKGKTIEELKEDLETLEKSLDKGKQIKRQASRRVKKTGEKLRKVKEKSKNKGLDGLLDIPDDQDISVSDDGLKSLSDFTPGSVDIDDNQRGVDIEEIKGLDDILDE